MMRAWILVPRYWILDIRHPVSRVRNLTFPRPWAASFIPLASCRSKIASTSLTTNLEQLHQHGLMHRDLKPRKVIFRLEGSTALQAAELMQDSVKETSANREYILRV